MWRGEHHLASLDTLTLAPNTARSAQTITARQPSARVGEHVAAPWVLTTSGGWHISGAYWARQADPSAWLGLSVMGAKLVYSALLPGSLLHIG